MKTELDIYKAALATRTTEYRVIQQRFVAECIANERLREKVAALEAALKGAMAAKRAPEPEPANPAADTSNDYVPMEGKY